MTKRRYCRGALPDAGLPRGRPRRPDPSADLLSFLFSINYMTRVSPFSSDIIAVHPRTTLHHWEPDSDCPLRRLKTANTRRPTRIQSTRFYRMLNCEARHRSSGLNASKPERTNQKWVLLPNLRASCKQKKELFFCVPPGRARHRSEPKRPLIDNIDGFWEDKGKAGVLGAPSPPLSAYVSPGRSSAPLIVKGLSHL
jgi:hypothetical protein